VAGEGFKRDSMDAPGNGTREIYRPGGIKFEGLFSRGRDRKGYSKIRGSYASILLKSGKKSVLRSKKKTLESI